MRVTCTDTGRPAPGELVTSRAGLALDGQRGGRGPDLLGEVANLVPPGRGHQVAASRNHTHIPSQPGIPPWVRFGLPGGWGGQGGEPGSFGLRLLTGAAAADGAVGREPGRAQRQPRRGLDLG